MRTSLFQHSYIPYILHYISLYIHISLSYMTLHFYIQLHLFSHDSTFFLISFIFYISFLYNFIFLASTQIQFSTQLHSSYFIHTFSTQLHPFTFLLASLFQYTHPQSHPTQHFFQKLPTQLNTSSNSLFIAKQQTITGYPFRPNPFLQHKISHTVFFCFGRSH